MREERTSKRIMRKRAIAMWLVAAMLITMIPQNLLYANAMEDSNMPQIVSQQEETVEESGDTGENLADAEDGTEQENPLKDDESDSNLSDDVKEDVIESDENTETDEIITSDESSEQDEAVAPIETEDQEENITPDEAKVVKELTLTNSSVTYTMEELQNDNLYVGFSAPEDGFYQIYAPEGYLDHIRYVLYDKDYKVKKAVQLSEMVGDIYFQYMKKDEVIYCRPAADMSDTKIHTIAVSKPAVKSMRAPEAGDPFGFDNTDYVFVNDEYALAIKQNILAKGIKANLLLSKSAVDNILVGADARKKNESVFEEITSCPMALFSQSGMMATSALEPNTEYEMMYTMRDMSSNELIALLLDGDDYISFTTKDITDSFVSVVGDVSTTLNSIEFNIETMDQLGRITYARKGITPVGTTYPEINYSVSFVGAGVIPISVLNLMPKQVYIFRFYDTHGELVQIDGKDRLEIVTKNIVQDLNFSIVNGSFDSARDVTINHIKYTGDNVTVSANSITTTGSAIGPDGVISVSENAIRIEGSFTAENEVNFESNNSAIGYRFTGHPTDQEAGPEDVIWGLLNLRKVSSDSETTTYEFGTKGEAGMPDNRVAETTLANYTYTGELYLSNPNTAETVCTIPVKFKTPDVADEIKNGKFELKFVQGQSDTEHMLQLTIPEQCDGMVAQGWMIEDNISYADRYSHFPLNANKYQRDKEWDEDGMREILMPYKRLPVAGAADTSLISGREYEYIVRVAGIEKHLKFTYSDGEVQYNPTVTVKSKTAFEAELEFDLFGGNETLRSAAAKNGDTFKLEMTLQDVSDSKSATSLIGIGGITLTSAEGYKDTFNNSFMGTMLTPNTRYCLGYRISKTTAIDGKALYTKQYFTTDDAVDLYELSVDSYIDGCEVMVSSSDAYDFSWVSETGYIGDGKNYDALQHILTVSAVDGEGIIGKNVFKSNILLTSKKGKLVLNSKEIVANLSDNKKYVVQLWDRKGEQVLCEKEFTTAVDDREITVDAKTYVEGAIISFETKGNATWYPMPYVLYYREKKDGTNPWIYADGAVNSGEVRLVHGELEQGKTYEYEVGYGATWSSEKRYLTKVKSGEITIPTEDRTITSKVSEYYDRVIIDLTLQGTAPSVNTEIQGFYKEADNADDDWRDIYPIVNQFATTEIPTYGIETKTLTPGKKYDVIIGYAGNYGVSIPDPQVFTVSEQTSFTVPEDDYAVVVDHTTIQQYAFIVSGTVKGAEKFYEVPVLKMYFRKVGRDEWSSVSVAYSTETATFKAQADYEFEVNTPVAAGTEYEYKIGFDKTYPGSVDTLLKPVGNTVKTSLETGKLSFGKWTKSASFLAFTPIYASDVPVEVGNVSVYGFYREKGSTGAKVFAGENKIEFFAGETQGHHNGSTDCVIRGLKPNTKYEVWFYLDQAGLSTAEVNSLLERTSDVYLEESTDGGNVFMTATYIETASTADEAVVDLKVNGLNPSIGTVVVNFALDGQPEQSVVFQAAKDFTERVTFSNLLGDTEYVIKNPKLKYANVIAGQLIDEEYTLSASCSFKTKKVDKPTSFKLNESEVRLTISGEMMLDVTAEPSTAGKTAIWSSSNPQVVSVDEGWITALAAGEATITATSKYEPTVSATCKVIVKDYVVAENKDNALKVLTPGTVMVHKNDVISNLALYERASDGTLTEIPDPDVFVQTAYIAQWNAADKALKAKAIGTTDVYFGKDRYYSRLIVKVLPSGSSFAIDGIKATDFETEQQFPAIDKGNYTYLLAGKSGLQYRVEGSMLSGDSFEASDYEWTSDDASIVSVSDGILTIHKEGSAEIRVKEKNATNAQEKVLNLLVKPLPNDNVMSGATPIYAYTNIAKTLADIDLNVQLMAKGWRWENSTTPLYENYYDGYDYPIYYATNDCYPCRTKVRVYVSTMTGITVSGNGLASIAADGKDTHTFLIRPDFAGNGKVDDVQFEVADVAGLTIQETGIVGGYKGYAVTGTKLGKYTLKIKATLKGKEIKGVGLANYNLQVTDAPVAMSVMLFSTDADIENKRTGNLYSFEDKPKEFTIKADVKDKYGQDNPAKLEWTVSDKSIATISVAADTRSVKVNFKDYGDVTIMAKAKDSFGARRAVRLEYRNHKPIISTTKMTVNTVFDYFINSDVVEYEGIALANAMYGNLEIAQPYGDVIETARIVDASGKEAPVELIGYGVGNDSGCNKYVAAIKYGATPISGKYNYKLIVQSKSWGRDASGEQVAVDYTHQYDLEITVVNTMPKITTKVTNKMNLFYREETDLLTVTFGVPNSYTNAKSFDWVDKDAAHSGNEFGFVLQNVNSTEKGVQYNFKISSDNVNVVNKKPEAGTESGTLNLRINGIKNPIAIPVNIPYSYKAPVIVAKDVQTGKTESMISKDLGIDSALVMFYDNTHKVALDRNSYSIYGRYDSITSKHETLQVAPGGNIDKRIIYSGNAAKENVTMQVESGKWREPVNVKYVLKNGVPKVKLLAEKLTINRTKSLSTTTSIVFKDSAEGVFIGDMDIVGTTDAAKQAFDKDLLQLTMNGTKIEATVNDKFIDADAKVSKLKDGTYAYKLTPYYVKPDGDKAKLNTVTLKINVTSKPVTAKITVKGTLDLMDTANVPTLTPKFSNLTDHDTVENLSLSGDYSDYFAIVRCYNPSSSIGYDLKLQPKSMYLHKIKANSVYSLTVSFTMLGKDGFYTVKSDPFKVKPIKGTTTVKVYKDKQNFYASVDNMTREYRIQTAKTSYNISNVYGALDVNGDGANDILVFYPSDGHFGPSAVVKVTILDKNALKATTKGTVYKVPVNVSLINGSAPVKTTISLVYKK